MRHIFMVSFLGVDDQFFLLMKTRHVARVWVSDLHTPSAVIYMVLTSWSLACSQKHFLCMREISTV